ncbi:MAG: NAD-binding protein, partial [Candidatus Riflebacteria bacterium]|nr:NAD-binding protein [Candidatus Riflebacteria bacterium]
MRIVIVGIGKVGLAITKMACEAKHEVTVIDSNQKVIENVSNSFDVLGLCGNACSLDILKAAGTSKCKIFIAATESDEAN